MKRHRLDIALGLTLFVLALALRVRATAWLLESPARFPQGDDVHYYAITRSLIAHGVFGVDGVPTAYRMPLFPLFAAFWHALLGVEPYTIMPVLLGLGALIPVGTYLLGRSVAGPLVGLLAGLLSAVDRDLAVYSGLYMTEILFCCILVFGLFAASRLRATGRWPWAVAMGLLFGCATITRANFGPFVALALLWVVWVGRDNLRRALGQAALVGALVLALWAPWVVRNYLVFDALIPFTTQGGNGYYGLYNDEVAAQPFGLRYGLWVSRFPPGGPGQLDEVAADRLQRDLARQWMRANPEQALRIALMQPVQLWAPFTKDMLSWALTTVIGLPALIVFALRRRQPDLVLWLGLILTATVMALASLAVTRFALPLRVVLAVTASMFIVGLADGLAAIRRRAPPAVLTDYSRGSRA